MNDGSARSDLPLLQAELLVDSDLIGRARMLYILDSTLWVVDKAGDPYLHQFHIGNGVHVASLGRSGAGPGDFNGVGNLSTDGPRLWAFDLYLRRMTELRAQPDSEVPKTITVPEGVMPMDMFWLAPGRLALIGQLDSNRFMFANDSGEIQATVPAPLLGHDSVPLPARAALSTGFIACASQERKQFVIAYVGAGKVEIVDEAGRVTMAAVPAPSNGDFSRRDDGSWKPETYFRHYESCAVTPRWIYLLYAGKQTRTPEERANISASELQVYDWSGRLETRWSTSTAVSSIAVSGDSILVAVEAETGSLVRFQLPDTWQE